MHPDDREYFDALLLDGRAQLGAAVTGEFRVRHADGSTRHVDAIVSNLLDDPTVGGLVFNARDVTDRKLLEDELERRAFFDALTGLPNRAVFRDRLDHALAGRVASAIPLAVLLLDLDGFKLVNDSFGHDAGDELLVAVGGRLQGCLRSGDTVARLGGDEFAILLEDAASEVSAVALAERLLEALAPPFDAPRPRGVHRREHRRVACTRGRHRTPRRADQERGRRDVRGEGRRQGHGARSSSRRCTDALSSSSRSQADLQRALVEGSSSCTTSRSSTWRPGSSEGSRRSPDGTIRPVD